ncbi:S-layer homology domain-containing protein [Paenibacillus sp. YYML68]|uniref:S-layer homology domain-containing protein n=1 Tax=Paenibacillus sp. YYML68 TaxID=2909250 RepID=UPI0024902AFF|nr:S-layer homology domain-containing protein [Paenibacillus sp. YYML68]
MNKWMRRTIAAAGSFALLLAAPLQQWAYAAAETNGPSIVKVNNDYVQVDIKRDNGRFSIKNLLGDSTRPSDNDAPLLYKDKEPETSFATFRVGGKDYIYGNPYGFLNMSGTFSELPQTTGGVNTSVWNVGAISIRQTLEVVSDVNHPNVGNVRVRYEAKNNGSQPEAIGARILLDTMLGTNDGAGFMAGGSGQDMTKEQRLTGSQIPAYWRSVDNKFNPAVFGYGLVSGWGNEKPHELVFGHWNKLSETKWDFTPDSTLDFTKTGNPYGTADSAVALYWNPNSLAPGESRVYETYYGVGNFMASAGSPYRLQTFAPTQLTVNEAKDGYTEQEFEIKVEMDNTQSGARALTNVTAGLILEDGLLPVTGQPLQQTTSAVAVNGSHTFTFKVKAAPQSTYTVKEYRIDVKADEYAEAVSGGGFIMLPGIAGTPPAVQFEKIGPETVYKEGTRYMTVKGQGFDVLKDLSRWELWLEQKTTGEKTLIPARAITVSSDTDLMVKVEGEYETGEYQFVLKHELFGTLRAGQMITVSDDTKYIGQYYGLLVVRKTVAAGEDPVYSLVSLDGEEALEKLKEDLPASDSIVLEIRGDIMERTEDGQTQYVVGTEKNAAEINSVIEYKGKPLTLVKQQADSTHISDYIEMTGDGSLRISDGGMEFWKYEFALELKDGEDYSLDPQDDQEPVTLELTGLGKAVKMISGFAIEINDVILQEKALSFSGLMALSFLPGGKSKYTELKEQHWGTEGNGKGGDLGKMDDSLFSFSASVDSVLYGEKDDGKVGFVGIDTTASLQLPEDFLGGFIKSKKSASLTINTIDNIYGVDLEAEIKVIEFHGILTIAIVEGSPTIDDLFISAGGEPGIMISPAVFLTKLGGGVEDFSSASDGPGKIVVQAALKFAKVLEGDFILKISWFGFTLTGELAIAKLPFLKEVSVDARWAAPAKLELNAALNVLDIVIGQVYVYISGERFEGYAKAGLIIPKFIPIAGGKTLAGIELGVSSESIWGAIEIIGIPIGIRYYWGRGVEFIDAEGNVSLPPGMYTQLTKADNGEPVYMVFGGNIRRTTADPNRKETAYMLASRSDIALAEAMQLLAAGVPANEHTIPVTDQPMALFKVNYTGEKPQLQVFRPDGTELPLIAEGQPNSNYLEQTVSAAESTSGQEEKWLYVSVQAPENGGWRIQSSSPVTVEGFEVDPVPVLDTVGATKLNERELQVNWMATNADQAKVTISLVTDYEQAGVVLADQVDATAGQATVTVPSDTMSGPYYVRVSMSDGQYGHDLKFTELLTLTDPDAPASITGPQVSLFGDGKLDVTWTPSPTSGVTSYIVEVFDEAGARVESQGEQVVDPSEPGVIIGGQYKSKTGETLGLAPGHKYRVGITAERKTDDGASHYSETVLSELIELPVPNPAELTVTMGEPFKALDAGNGSIEYVANQSLVTLDFKADQNVRTRVKVNGAEVDFKEGEEWSISLPVSDGQYRVEFLSVNDQGDSSSKTVQFAVDTAAPLLLVEPGHTAAEPGVLLVSGKTDREATLRLEGQAEPVVVSQDGSFTARVEMGAQQSKEVRLTAVDRVGNEASFSSELVNTTLKPLAEVKLKPYQELMKQGDAQTLTLAGKAADGSDVQLHAASIKWSLLMGSSVASVTEDGYVTATGTGKALVRAAYYTTDSFAFEDVAVIDVKSETVTVDPQLPAPPPDNVPPPPSGGGGPIDGSLQEQLEKSLEALLAELINKDNRLKLVGSYKLEPGSTKMLPLGEYGTLTVPDGVLQQDDAIAVSQLLDDQAYKAAGAPHVYHGPLFNLRFAHAEPRLEQPLKLELAYDAAQVTDVEQLGLYRYNSRLGKWQYVDGVVRSSSKTITAEVDQLGTFALIENKAMQRMEDMGGRWSDKYVKTLRSLDIVDGVERDGSAYFEPQREITRLEFTKLLVSVMSSMGVKPTTTDGSAADASFADWSSIPEWGRSYVQAAYANGWVSGTDSDAGVIFDADASISRAQAVTMLGRTMSGAPNTEVSFADRADIPSWAQPHVGALVKSKIVSGYPDGSFQPSGLMTREEAAKVIAQWLDKASFE